MGKYCGIVITEYENYYRWFPLVLVLVVMICLFFSEVPFYSEKSEIAAASCVVR